MEKKNKLDSDKYDFDKPKFSMQWHITSDCGNKCKHCYMKRDDRTLSFKDCKLIIDDFCQLVKCWDAEPRVYLTGGDPLLSPYFYDIFEHLREKLGEKVKIGVLGNPETLTETNLNKLSKLKPFFYQLSIDGLKDRHDYIRYDGSFERTIKAIEDLKLCGIKVAIMSTVNNVNINDLVPVIDLAADKKVRFFDFARFSPTNHHDLGESGKTLIPPLKYREVLFAVLDRYDFYQNVPDSITLFGRKDPLWALVELEKGRLNKVGDKKYQNLIIGGCNIGANAISILHDGTVFGCRRIAEPIGTVPQQSLRDIFIKSKSLNKMREVHLIEKCKECELLMYCRGCRAIAYGYMSNFFAADPQCWKK